MKNLIVLFLISLCSVFAYGQSGQPTVQGNGASPYFTTAMHIVTPQGTAKAIDTLSNADTGRDYIWVGEGFDMSFELTRRVISGTVATESQKLYGYNNGGRKLTAAQAATVTGTAITGNTTYCAGCVATTYTVVPTGTVKTKWQIPRSSGCLFDNYYLETIQTGTVTATHSATVSTQR
ncbi:MAG: hypothetical protein K0Q79_2748 [Flavipsychrobacter sp.]|jgi:hypothetical protein|nr:hypothetical protein [Flavipsychrobacter sp.]